jgi:phosphatidylglycerophosphate synthase
VDRQEYLSGWSALHEGIDPAGVPFVRGWLSLMYGAGRPLAAAKVPPSAITLAGVLSAWGAALVAGGGARWPLLAVVLVIASAFADGLDGAVAVLSRRVSAAGATLDTVCDRISDAAYAVGLWLLGAPAWSAVLWVVLTYGLELVRWRARRGVSARLDVVTVGERPTRIIVTAFTLAGAGVVAGHGGTVAAVGVAAGCLTSGLGLVQLVVVLRRRLAEPAG